MQIPFQYRRLHLQGGHLLIIQFSRGNSNQESFLEDKWFCYGARGGDLVDFWTFWSEHAFSMHSTLSSYFLRPSIQQWFVFRENFRLLKKDTGYRLFANLHLYVMYDLLKNVAGLTIDFLFINHGKYFRISEMSFNGNWKVLRTRCFGIAFFRYYMLYR